MYNFLEFHQNSFLSKIPAIRYLYNTCNTVAVCQIHLQQRPRKLDVDVTL